VVDRTFRRTRSRTEERSGHHGDAVGTTVGVLAGGNDDRVDEVGSEPIAKPDEMTNVVVVHIDSELAFDRDHAPISTFDDEVDLAFTTVRSEMMDASLGSIRIWPQNAMTSGNMTKTVSVCTKCAHHSP
jgi:hypothetical protein